MAGTGQDNPSGETPKYPAVRLKTLPKKPNEAPPSTPIEPPTPPTGRPEIRIRRLAPKAPEGGEAPAPVESPVVETQAPPAAAAESEPLAADPQPGTQCVDSDSEEHPKSVEMSLDAAGRSACATSSPIEYPEPQYEEPPAPVPEPTPPPPAVSNVPRIRKLARPAPIEEPAAPAASTAPEPSAAPPPAGLPYPPDTVPEHMYRRMWWKYDLRVKSNREPPAGNKP